MLESKADIYFVQECKVKEEEKGKMVSKFKEENYEAIIGPCNKDIKKTSAGVGCVSKDEKATIVITEHLTEAFKQAHEMGRAEKYLIDL